jgi:hypothetical protein
MQKGPSQQQAALKLKTTPGRSREDIMSLKGQHSYSNDYLGDDSSASQVFSIEKEHRLLKPSSEHDDKSPCSSQTTPLPLDVDSSLHCNDCSVQGFSSAALSDEEMETTETPSSFLIFRLNYLLVTMVIMLSDALQGKSLSRYLLYSLRWDEYL